MLNPKTRDLALTLALAATAAVASAGPASASTAKVSNADRIVVTGTGNEANQVVVSYVSSADAYLIADPVGIAPSAPCLALDPTVVSCPGAGIGSFTIRTRGGEDSVTLDPATMPATVEGDVNGGSGDDAIIGSGADDVIAGGSGRDLLDGGAGSDEIKGGRGTDTVSYAGRTAGVVVTIGSKSDDGNALDLGNGRRDRVRGDVEAVSGGAGADLIVGDASSETLNGGPGDDALYGRRGHDALAGFAGNDFLSGGGGADTLRASAGHDRLLGGDGNDRLAAGPGDDVLRGGPGWDAMNGKGGSDRIKARDGARDRKINCGPGPNRREWAKRDRRDPRAHSC